MQLINVRELVLEEFASGDEPPYVILSHRWLSGEVSQKDFIQSKQSAPIRSTPGYKKIAGLCDQAIKDGYAYAWIDTCCIDNTSSAELSEAINSMFKWYKQAGICYAYLSDVPAASPSSSTSSSSAALTASDKDWWRSEWFTRGWTLQELLAPDQVIFFDASWTYIGTKGSLGSQIQAITGIDESILGGLKGVSHFSVARRMSWASGRKTSRPEDVAYALMGLFDVNMPLLYGEGHKAFIRLQEEMLKNSDDHSIFAWKDSGANDFDACGLLATSPDHFSDCGAHVPISGSDPDNLLVTLNNTGLSIKLQIVQDRDVMYGILNCHASHVGQRANRRIVRPAVYLDCINVRAAQFKRVRAHSLYLTEESATSHRIYVKSSVPPPSSSNIRPLRARMQTLRLFLFMDPKLLVWGRKPLLEGCWVAPESFVLEASTNQPGPKLNPTAWSFLRLDNATRENNVHYALSKCLFQLPPFLDYPVVVLQFDGIRPLVVRRGPQAGVILHEASMSLFSAVTSSRPLHPGLWMSDSTEVVASGEGFLVGRNDDVYVDGWVKIAQNRDHDEFDINISICQYNH